MSSKRIKINCSNGFTETSFYNREAAERWIEDFKKAQKRSPTLCQGEHTIADEEESGSPTDGSEKGV